MIGLEYLVRGAGVGEAGILVPFEESIEAVRTNALTLGWDLAELERERRLFVVDARPDYGTVVSGDFDIKGLLTIIDGVAREIGARRLVLDAMDVLLRHYDNPAREREQLFLLNEWLMERGFTSVITVKRSDGIERSSRYEFLDYLADCLIHLNQCVADQVTVRRLRVVKYRGSDSWHNEYPYVTSAEGVKVIPISEVELRHQPLHERLTSGHPGLDNVLGGGFFLGGCVLIAGASGTGKTTLASTFARVACARGERVLFLSFEESAESMVHSMLSSGTDLRPARDSGTLRLLTAMPEALGAEEHLIRFLETLEQFSPHHVILETISAVVRMGPERAAFEYVVRVLNACRQRGSTVFFTDQTVGNQDEIAVAGKSLSSLVDTIVYLRYVEIGGEINRLLSVVKSRGSYHSNQLREFRITSQGVEILPVYAGEGGMLTGAARQEQEVHDAVETRRLRGALDAKRREIARHQAVLEAENARLLAAVQQAEAELTGLELEAARKEESHSERGRMRQGKFDV
jgi:circadian clock protein KaiC